MENYRNFLEENQKFINHIYGDDYVETFFMVRYNSGIND